MGFEFEPEHSNFHKSVWKKKNNFLRMKKNIFFVYGFFISCSAFLLISCRHTPALQNDFYSYARSRVNDLRLSVYMTAQAVNQLLSADAGRREALSVLKANGISKVYLEFYRSGDSVPVELLRSLSGFLKDNGFEVVGGIATVPGDDFGVRQVNGFDWFNWQNEKTQQDLKNLMLRTAPIFDKIIIDDFMCTSDTGRESLIAKGNRSWFQYRRDLMTRLSKELFIDPARSVHPGIQLIIKYPQWYDRYHLFGYDVSRQPSMFDQVWIGTETRGQYTRSFGYVQPYEGFVNFRWMLTLSGKKLGGAWFDHIDCSDKDFIDQAYQSVLGGAKEIILFNYFNLVEGHPGQHLLRMEFNLLADLAKEIDATPVAGISAYKPPNSDAGGDLYIMDYIGMFGVPLIPVSRYPEGEKMIFLPTQAADDSLIYSKLSQSLVAGSTIIMTSGFIAHAREGEKIAGLAGVQWPITGIPVSSKTLIDHGHPEAFDPGLILEFPLKLTAATPILEAIINGGKIPYLCRNPEGNIYILNSHTFSQEDFAAMDEVLLCPRPLGMMDLPRNWVNTIREAFTSQLDFSMDAPARVTSQPFGDGEMMIQNYNEKEITVRLAHQGPVHFTEVLSGKELPVHKDTLEITIPPRSRAWLKPAKV